MTLDQLEEALTANRSEIAGLIDGQRVLKDQFNADAVAEMAALREEMAQKRVAAQVLEAEATALEQEARDIEARLIR